MAETTFKVRFEEESTTLSEMYGALIGLVVDLEADDSYPTGELYVLRVDGDGDVVVCELDESGKPMDHSTWAIPQGSITGVSIAVGSAA